MVHFLDLQGDRRSGRTILALDLLEYANLGNRNVAYVVPTARDLRHIKATGTSVLLLTYYDIVSGKGRGSGPLNLAVVDHCGLTNPHERGLVEEILKTCMVQNDFAQIIRLTYD
jgi:hypothetical protein